MTIGGEENSEVEYFDEVNEEWVDMYSPAFRINDSTVTTAFPYLTL